MRMLGSDIVTSLLSQYSINSIEDVLVTHFEKKHGLETKNQLIKRILLT